ncbi:MAG: GTP cyclohydrolase I [Chlorobi bacterium]|nr:GTP cyclohydrolase I [Chlorobiota bacterium]
MTPEHTNGNGSIMVTEKRPLAFDANGNMPLDDDELDEMVAKLQAKFGEIMDILRIDRAGDPNSRETPRRLARMWVRELFIGRYTPPPAVTIFPNRKRVNELIVSTGIKVMSVCSHHWQPISGTCTIGYMPGDYIIGLSKLTRIVEWFSRRGQIQEEMGEQIADYLEQLLKPRALGVIIQAKHYCMIARGVEADHEQSDMITSVLRGQLQSDANLRTEFLRLASP